MRWRRTHKFVPLVTLMGMIVRMTGELVGNMGDNKGRTHKQHGEHHQNITTKKKGISWEP